MFDDLIDAFYDIFDVFVSIWSFLWALIKFIVFWFKTVLNLIYQAFTYIFSTDLYDWIWDTIDNLSLYMWVPWATALLSLFIIAFLLIFIWLIFRVIKWQVNYKATLKKYEKK